MKEETIMKKIKVAIVGFGNRGEIYADYSLAEPKESQVVAIIDPNKARLDIAKKKYKLKDNQLFIGRILLKVVLNLI